LLEGFSFPITPADKELRESLEALPTSMLYAQLSTIDPAAATKIHPNDKKRIIRALEVHKLTGKPISDLQITRDPRLATRDLVLIGLGLPREELYERINQRVDSMIAKGLIEEVKDLLAKGYSKELFSFQALGYKEAIECLDGRWTKNEMIEELKKRTRNFARRQMTWFRRFADVNWFSPGQKDDIIKLCQGRDNKK
jgi:tRNA dimethylallyltransferase